ncbi:MAG: hypothetical protein ACXU7H_07795 [Burkholderiaceae bacterium]
MTTQKHDQSEEEAFDDFLQGRGELVKQLKALSQLTPSAALDAAILASAKAAVSQAERSKQTAANDPVSPRKPGFVTRFRLPLAMAASLMLAVLVAVQWHAQPESSAPIQVAQAPAPEPTPTPASELPQLAQADMQAKTLSDTASRNAPAAAPTMSAAKPSGMVADSRALTSEKKTSTQIAANAAANDAAKSAAARADAAPTQLAQADTSQLKFKSMAMQEERVAAAPAPAVPPAATSAAAPSVAGNLAKESARAAPPPVAVQAFSPQTTVASLARTDSQEKQKAWLARIEEMIKADSRKEALAEWEKFEKAYPDYPVSEKLKAQIKALKN